MCGIAGVSHHRGAPERQRLQRMAAALAHRGPDDADVFAHAGTGLAHTRLSIIDVAGGHQPLFVADGAFVLVANGEIYNHVELRAELEAKGHRFATHSDCETILHAYVAYGDDFLEHLSGMFAFALFDRERDRLLLVRDRLGIKPLYLARFADGLAFASELKAFKALDGVDWELDPAGLAGYLQTQFSTGHTTAVRGIERVLPGEMVWVQAGRIQGRRQYWSPRQVRTNAMDFDQAAERFDGLMETVMRQHMRTDVPYGLFLSGGVDSAILLALLARYTDEPVRTFSVGFPHTATVDELPNARRLAEQFATRHTLLEADRDAMFQRLPFVTWAADDPMQDYANLPTSLLAETAGAELKVVFTGEGGDEAFAGYGRYRMSALERFVRAVAAPGSGGFRTRGVFRGRWPARLFGPELGQAAHAWRAPFIDAWAGGRDDWSAVQRMQYTDLVTALPDNLLVKVDRMLMGWGVEGRVPFVDHRVVEFGLSLPDALKVDGKQGKAFLKRWAESLLPQDILWRRKRGFAVPVGEWMRGAYLDRLEKVLPTHPLIRHWFRPAGVRALIDAQRRSGGHTRALWTLLQLAIWHSIIVDGDAARPAARQDPLDLIA